MDFRDEDDEDEYDDDERPRRRIPRKSRLLRSIRRRISVVKPRTSREPDEDDASSREEDEDDFGFSKRRPNKRSNKKKDSGPTKRKSKDKQKKSKEEPKPAGARLSRATAQRTLRTSSLSKDEAEGGDVAMPLPGQKKADASVNGSRSTSSNKSTTNKKGFGRIRSALVKSNSSDAAKKNKTTIRSGGSSTKSHQVAPRPRQRRRKSNASEDRSVDSIPPSVASTEYSVDLASRAPLHQHAQLQHQARLQQRNNKNSKNNGLPSLFFKRDPDDETGANMEAMSMDYYYQSLPWIIKTWIYFVTVVVPFTILYYCFVGIFHSTTLSQNPFLQKVCFSNMIFAGLGCTFRSHFFARQALDAKGVQAKRSTPTLITRINTGGSLGGGGRRLPRRNRSRDSTTTRQQQLQSNNKASILLPRSMTMTMARNLPRPRRKSVPNNNNNSSTNRFLTNYSDRGSYNTPRRNSLKALAENTDTLNSPRTTAFGNGSGFMGNNSQHSNNMVHSVWDVEHMIPARKQSTKPKRSMGEKHASILEIYDVHAKDEHVSLLQ